MATHKGLRLAEVRTRSVVPATVLTCHAVVTETDAVALAALRELRQQAPDVPSIDTTAYR
jgi:hypothetical protein